MKRIYPKVMILLITFLGLNILGSKSLAYTFADVYEIPADAKGLTLRVGDLEFLGSDVAIVDLGL